MYCLTIDPKVPMDYAWEQLENSGIEMGYSEEDESQTKIYVFTATSKAFEDFEWITHFEPYELPDIDWNAQWEAHGLDYREGFVHLDLSVFGREAITLKLEPGPGFGDLSHPTTRLVLKLLAENLTNQSVIDIGCGSGVLSLAAAAMGAPIVYGIDIDPAALDHSKKNAEINQLGDRCHFCLPTEFTLDLEENYLILMNMIMSEQKVAWESLPSLHSLKGTILTSGIRVEERELYLAQAEQWGWQCQKEIEEDGWLAFQY